jgi:hypothetical protein
MDEGTARAALNAVAKKWSELTYIGLQAPSDGDFAVNRGRLAECEAEFRRAYDWLVQVPVRSSINRSHGSYGLKHAAEAWSGDYVSNGALIAAALHLGLRMEPIAGTPNAYFNVAAPSKWPRATGRS